MLVKWHVEDTSLVTASSRQIDPSLAEECSQLGPHVQLRYAISRSPPTKSRCVCALRAPVIVPDGARFLANLPRGPA
jgi:hypothetical protein